MAGRPEVQMGEAEVSAFLEEPHTLALASHRPDGSVHLVAMWYGFLPDGTLALTTHERSQKARNLRRDPRFTAMAADGHAYEELRGIELVGTARVVDDHETLLAATTSTMARYAAVPAAGLREAAEAALHRRVAILLHPERVVSWDHRKLGAGPGPGGAAAAADAAARAGRRPR